jgi:hypothetical protein
MEPIAKMIYRTFKSHLPTGLPVNYYGLPNGDVYIIYSRFYQKGFDNQGLEFVFAYHEEFYYDYECENLILLENNRKLFPVMTDMIDKPNPKIRIRKVLRRLSSYTEAQSILNSMATKMG